MKQIRILLFAVMLVLVMPAGYASISDSTTYYYNRSQVDSIVAAEVQRQLGTAVKSEVAKQVDTELIDLKIDYSKAIDTYTRIIMKNPDDAEAFLNRGKSYKSNGEYDNAMKDAKKSLEIATRSGDATLIERINKTIKEIEETRTPQAKATTN